MDATEPNPYEPTIASIQQEQLDIPLITVVRLRQSVVTVFVSLTAGLIGWFVWIGFRQGDHKLIAIMSCLFGGLFLLLAAFSTVVLFFQSIRLFLRFQTGLGYFICAAIALPFLSIPFFVN